LNRTGERRIFKQFGQCNSRAGSSTKTTSTLRKEAVDEGDKAVEVGDIADHSIVLMEDEDSFMHQQTDM
jgi:hypothetical protein